MTRSETATSGADTAPDLTDAVAYVATGLHARPGETWFTTTSGQVHHRRQDGTWNPASILTAADLQGSPVWQRVDT
jgi:hypothetical protein